ncbi:MAG: hypothetical protein KJ811_02800, partial [Candidatus Margulisbacteria bacterium]|nr:hypothetical protein [Candidatus Margulisiibacteriota bacterium]
MLKRVLLGFLLIFMVSSQGLALYVKTADSVIIPKNVVITDNLFAAGKEVVIDGIVTGNLVAFGEKVTVNGEVGGTVIVGGEDVIVNGVVKMDLFAGGKNLLLAKSSRVGKDVFIGAEKASVAGKIFRDLRIGGSNINIVETAMVKGAVDYATKNMNLSKAAQIKGKIAAHDGPNVEGFKKEIAGSFNDFMVVRRVISILTIFALGLALIFLVPNQVRLINTQMVSH